MGPGGSLSPAVTAPDTHCKSAALSTFRKSCLALSKMSGSSLGTAGRREGGGEWEMGGGERKHPINAPQEQTEPGTK